MKIETVPSVACLPISSFVQRQPAFVSRHIVATASPEGLWVQPHWILYETNTVDPLSPRAEPVPLTSPTSGAYHKVLSDGMSEDRD